MKPRLYQRLTSTATVASIQPLVRECWEAMRRWKVWLASNAHNCCPKDTKHKSVIVITLSHGAWTSDGGRKGMCGNRPCGTRPPTAETLSSPTNGTNHGVRVAHHGLNVHVLPEPRWLWRSSVAAGRTITFWSQGSFLLCGLIAIRTIDSVSESCFHICRLGHRKIPHKCAGSAAPGQSNALQLTYHLCSKSSSFFRVIHFISELLPLQKPKWSLLKPTCSLLPQSKRLSFDLSVLSLPGWVVYTTLGSRIEKNEIDHKLKAEVWLSDWW